MPLPDLRRSENHYCENSSITIFGDLLVNPVPHGAPNIPPKYSGVRAISRSRGLRIIAVSAEQSTTYLSFIVVTTTDGKSEMPR